MNQPLRSLSVKGFGRAHPGLNPDLLIEPTRVALASHHESPAPFTVTRPGVAEEQVQVHFDSPDPRSVATLERERFVELGAIVFAGLLLELEGKRITRVVPRRGWRFDYFVGDSASADTWILEVGGTEQGSLEALLRRKADQVRDSPYRLPPHNKAGYAAATRFARPGRSGLSLVAPPHPDAGPIAVVDAP